VFLRGVVAQRAISAKWSWVQLTVAKIVHTHVPLWPSSIIYTCQWAATLCGWEGNRRSGIIHWPCVIEFIGVIYGLRARSEISTPSPLQGSMPQFTFTLCVLVPVWGETIVCSLRPLPSKTRLPRWGLRTQIRLAA